MSLPKNKNFDERLAFNTLETARVLGLAPGTVNRWINSGLIPSVKMGTRRLISRATIDALLKVGVSAPERPTSPKTPGTTAAT